MLCSNHPSFIRKTLKLKGKSDYLFMAQRACLLCTECVLGLKSSVALVDRLPQ